MRPLCCLLLVSPAVFAGGIDEGTTFGRQQLGNVQSQAREANARAVVPGYGERGPTSLWGNRNGDFSGAITAQRTWCAQHPQAADATVDCSIDPTVQTSAANRKPLSQADAQAFANTQRRTVPGAPEGLGGRDGPGFALSGSYSGCSTRRDPQSPPRFDTQYCHIYAARTVDNLCFKDRRIDVTWHCPAVASFQRVAAGPILPPTKPEGIPHCVIETAVCPPDWQGPTWNGRGWFCQAPAPSGGTPPPPEPAVVNLGDAFATPTWTEAWVGCESFEAQVPPGCEPPLGQDGIPSGCTLQSLRPGNQGCERREQASSVLTVGQETRVISYLSFTRPTWQYQNAYHCIQPDPRSDCNQPRFSTGGCLLPDHQPQCTDRDPVDPSICTVWQYAYRCQVENPTSATTTTCAGQTYTVDGQTWDAGFQPNGNFAKSVSQLESIREGGIYFNADAMTLFDGKPDSCKKKLFGLVNCCNKSGSERGLFSNEALSTRPPGSPYMFDGLFAGDSKSWIERGLGPQAAMLMTDGTPTVDFLERLNSSKWAQGSLALQLAMLGSCEKRDKALALKRDEHLCVEVGNYCSRKFPILRKCLEQTYGYCCFNSRLAKLIAEQGRKQLNRGWGSPQSPDCRGFTVEELEQLKFDEMDFSDFYREINPVAPAQSAVDGSVNATVQCMQQHPNDPACLRKLGSQRR